MYCNAGHNPPLHFRSQEKSAVQELTKTGPLLGIIEDQTWDRDHVDLDPGDVRLLYTDGVTEAQNLQGEQYGTDRLIDTAKNKPRPSCQGYTNGGYQRC